jgi:hypothetical protein
MDREHSATRAVAQCGTVWLPKFDRWVKRGAEIYLPAGDGLYVQRIKKRRASLFRKTLKKWLLKDGAIVNLIITVQDEELLKKAREEWQPWKDEQPERFRVFILHRDRVSGPSAELTRSQIEVLDTFHPVLLVNSQDVSGNAMWIEAYHPVGSKFAYHVQFVVPADTENDVRFTEYKDMYRQLLQGSHVEELKSKVRRSMAA